MFKKVFKDTNKAETSNDLRTQKYVEKWSDILKLVPTCFAIRGHLKRCTYIIHLTANILSKFSDDSCQFAWNEEGGLLLSENFR